jgi:periplasmic divalent cation tolerance protein
MAKNQKKVTCAGGIVLYLDQVLVIRQNGNSWSLPKGHVDPGETLEIAARREIQEESGVSALTILKQLPSYQRFRLSLSGDDDLSEEKTMTMFLFETSDSRLAPQEAQSQAFWMPATGVGSMLSHPKDKAFYDQHLPLILETIRMPVICKISCPTVAVAKSLAEKWVAEHVVACVQIVPNSQSFYFWENEVQSSSEVLLFAKTFDSSLPILFHSLSKEHPYEVPECVVTKMTSVLPSYLEWMKKEIPQPY